MATRYNIAIIGATGVVGEALFEVLESRKFPVDKLFAVASHRSIGKTIQFSGQSYPVEDIETFDFSQADIAIFSAGASVSAEYAPKATTAGCVVIDNTSQFRYEADIPLVVPEVNPEAVAEFENKGIIANPNCSTIQLAVALKPIHDVAQITRVNVATYQAVSGTGSSAVRELARQSASMLNGQSVSDPEVYPKPIAFNVLPFIDTLQENGYSREEMKMYLETQKIFADDNLLVNATAVRVPVFYGHSEAVHLETARKLTAREAKELLAASSGITLVDDIEQNSYPTPLEHGSGQEGVFVGRVREDITTANGLNLWVVADNVRKGAATNSVQIAELLISDYL